MGAEAGVLLGVVAVVAVSVELAVEAERTMGMAQLALGVMV